LGTSFVAAVLLGTGRSPAPAAQTPGPAMREVTVLQVGDKVPQTTLVDQTGARFTFAKYLGQNLVVAFIYTRCPDQRECPLTSAKFGGLQQQLRGRDVHLIEMTLDPQFDTPAVLARYATVYGADPARWTFGTGKVDDVLNVDAAFGVDPFVDPRFGLIHSETLAMIDRRGTIRDLIYTNAWRPAEIISELDGLDNRAQNPIARLDLWLSKAAVAVCGSGVAGFSGFADLLVVLALFGGFGWLFWRLYRWIATSARSDVPPT
jgi:protein SCO1/2